MAHCPHCAGEIPDGAAGSHPGGSGPPPRRSRGRLLAAAVAFALVMAAVPVVARPILQHFRGDRCEPSNVFEWHAAMHRHCLTADYVCEHMTTPSLLEDPYIAQTIDGDAHELADLVGRMRASYGCSPERALPLEPEVIAPPTSPLLRDAPRSL